TGQRHPARRSDRAPQRRSRDPVRVPAHHSLSQPVDDHAADRRRDRARPCRSSVHRWHRARHRPTTDRPLTHHAPGPRLLDPRPSHHRAPRPPHQHHHRTLRGPQPHHPFTPPPPTPPPNP